MNKIYIKPMKKPIKYFTIIISSILLLSCNGNKINIQGLWKPVIINARYIGGHIKGPGAYIDLLSECVSEDRNINLKFTNKNKLIVDYSTKNETQSVENKNGGSYYVGGGTSQNQKIFDYEVNSNNLRIGNDNYKIRIINDTLYATYLWDSANKNVYMYKPLLILDSIQIVKLNEKCKIDDDKYGEASRIFYTTFTGHGGIGHTSHEDDVIADTFRKAEDLYMGDEKAIKARIDSTHKAKVVLLPATKERVDSINATFAPHKFYKIDDSK